VAGAAADNLWWYFPFFRQGAPVADLLAGAPARPLRDASDEESHDALVVVSTVKRVRLWIELLLVGVGYYVYSLIADRAPRTVDAAFARTRELRRLEADLHVGVEHTLNTWWAGDHLRMVLGNLYYDGAHFLAPGIVLVWLALRHREAYRPLRSVLLVTSLIGLAVFWLYPVAPPRLLPGAGFIDTVATVKTFGGGGSHGLSSSENPFAAMPSLHVAWAAWAALCVALVARRTWVRIVVWLHPIGTVFIIMATGNHLLADAVGGAAALGLGVWLVVVLRRGRNHPGLRSG